LADKPGFVVDSHSSGQHVTVRLKQPTRTLRGPHNKVPIWSCSEWGLPCHGMLPPARCALTAPFHPYLNHVTEITLNWRYILCCTCRRLSPPRCYLALCPMEPGLSSRRILTNNDQRLSGQLSAHRIMPNRATLKLFIF